MTLRSTRGSTTVDIDEIHDNTSQEVIYINSDKLKVILLEHLDRVYASQAWQTPLSLLITVVVVFASSTFNAALGLSADTWAAIFFLFGVLSLLWLIRCLVALRKGQTVDDVIAVIKNKVDGGLD